VTRLRRLTALPRQGTLDLVKMLPAVDGTRERSTPHGQDRRNGWRLQGLGLVVDGLGGSNHRAGTSWRFEPGCSSLSPHEQFPLSLQAQ
jgi:hypothetical protein